MTPAPKNPKRLSDPAANLPLTPLAFHILLAVGNGPRHGYAIILDIEKRTDGAMRLRSGTLYTALYRLQEDRLIAESKPRPVGDRNDERRRYYEVTSLGRRVAELEAARLSAMLRTARARNLYRTESAE